MGIFTIFFLQFRCFSISSNPNSSHVPVGSSIWEGSLSDALTAGAKSCPPVKYYTAEGVEDELALAAQVWGVAGFFLNLFSLFYLFNLFNLIQLITPPDQRAGPGLEGVEYQTSNSVFFFSPSRQLCDSLRMSEFVVFRLGQDALR